MYKAQRDSCPWDIQITFEMRFALQGKAYYNCLICHIVWAGWAGGLKGWNNCRCISAQNAAVQELMCLVRKSKHVDGFAPHRRTRSQVLA